MGSVALLVSVLFWTTGASLCEPTSGNCRGACSGVNIQVNVGPGEGSQIESFIHMCNPSIFACASSANQHDPDTACRHEQSLGLCTVTTAPKQGLTWSQVCSCADLAVHRDGGM